MRILRPGLVALILVAGALTACFREGDENTNEGVDTSAGETAVEVVLADDAIEMPDEVPAGPVVFEVTNGGTADHGFAIDGIDGSIDSLAPDGLESLRAELEPGTYTVFSPVAGDRDAGLERELTVTEAEGGGGDNLSDEGVGPSDEQAPADD